MVVAWAAVMLAAVAQAALTNVNVLRTIDLTGSGIARSRVSVKVANAGAQPATSYVVSVPSDVATTVSFVGARQRGDADGSGKEFTSLRVTKAEVDGGEQDGYVAYSVSLNEPLAAGATAVLEIAIVYTQLVRPYPAVVSQNDEQYLLLALNAYIDSPYETAKQKTTIKMPTAVTMGNELIGPEPISKKGFTVTYGPYADIKPFQSSPLYLHYKDKNAILVVKSLSREMEISHWGSNLGVTEYYDLHNKGAALRDKLFSRIDFSFARYTRGSTTNVVEELKVILPPKTSNLYYRDEIGNVSTSHFRKSAYHESILEIKPRYPLYGGWRYSWHHTYDVPLNDYLKVDRRTGRHVLQVKFMGSLSNVTIEHSRLKVALPEGAQNVKIALPFEADFQTIDQYWTNLDTVGRPLVIIEKKNVADEYAVPVQISYDYPTGELYRKPTVAAATLLALLLLGLVYTRLDFSLVHDGKPRATDVMDLQRAEVTKTLALGRTVYVNLDEAFDAYKQAQGADRAALEAARKKEGDKLAERVLVRLRKASVAARSVGEEAFAEGLEEVEGLLKDRLAKVLAYQDYVLAFLKDLKESDNNVDDKKREALAVKSKAVSADLESIDGQLNVIFVRLVV